MMADPIEYNSLVHMLSNHAPYLITGGVALIGGTMLLLRRMGVLIFDKEKIKPDDCQHCDLKKGKDGKILPKPNCVDHPIVIENQIKMLAQQDSNTAALRNGKKEFKEIKESIALMQTDVGILLDRTERILSRK